MGWVPDISKFRPNVQMNQDTRFGYHDFTVWPQYYFPETRHLAFARRRPADSELASDPFAILWHDPTRRDFAYEPGTVFTDLGRMSEELLEQVFECRQQLTRRIVTLKAQPPPGMRDVERAALTAAEDGIRLTSVCLRTAAQSYLATCATFTLFQRHALEGLACVEMLTVWAQRTRVDTDEVPFDIVDPAIMGAITSSIHVAIDLATLGVPVWLVRPPHLVPKSIKIISGDYPIWLPTERASIAIPDMKAYYIGAPTYGKNRACLALHLGHIHLGGRGEVYKEIIYGKCFELCFIHLIYLLSFQWLPHRDHQHIQDHRRLLHLAKSTTRNSQIQGFRSTQTSMTLLMSVSVHLFCLDGKRRCVIPLETQS